MKNKNTYKDDAQWLAACLRSVGLSDIADRLNEVQNSVQYQTAMTKYNSTKNNNNNIKWHKTPDDVFLDLTIMEYKVLQIFLKCSSIHNLLTISQDDLITYLGSDKKYIRKAINGLTDKFYIVKAIQGNKKRPTTYMVNPDLRTQGSVDVAKLKNAFFDLLVSQTDKSKMNDFVYTTLMPKKLYTYQYKANHKLPIDFEDINTLKCNVFSLTPVIDNSISDKSKDNKSQSQPEGTEEQVIIADTDTQSVIAPLIGIDFAEIEDAFN